MVSYRNKALSIYLSITRFALFIVKNGLSTIRCYKYTHLMHCRLSNIQKDLSPNTPKSLRRLFTVCRLIVQQARMAINVLISIPSHITHYITVEVFLKDELFDFVMCDINYKLECPC